MSNFSIQDKVTIVTGGTGVLGGSVARHFATEGAKVVILSRSKQKIEDKIKELSNLPGEVFGVECDVMKKDQLYAAREKILARFGQIDILINAAGGNVSGATQQEGQEVFDLNIDDIDSAMDLNIKGTLHPSLIFGEEICKSEYGSIINISSMVTYTAISRVLAYTIGKTGVNSLTRWMACELGQKFNGRIRVNAIAPGFFIGDQNRKLLLNEDGSLTDRSKRVMNKTPMRRFGNIDELNGAIQFLCSKEACFITGAVLPVDGGFSSFSGV